MGTSPISLRPRRGTPMPLVGTCDLEADALAGGPDSLAVADEVDGPGLCECPHTGAEHDFSGCRTRACGAMCWDLSDEADEADEVAALERAAFPPGRQRRLKRSRRD